ncbi:MAG: tetratricopeptide repeat protein, partial [Treponema sp.]|nr:tetratricopeptide repeat protein [Treponema sp.]
MPSLIRKLLFIRNIFRRPKPDPDEIAQEQWHADFNNENRSRFDIKSEISYDANLLPNLISSGRSLALSLKKTACIAWVHAPDHCYRDAHFSASIRINAKGGYAAGGVFFRMVDERTYYSLLISSKGYFRLDALLNGMPQPLVGWTELPLFTGAVLGANESVDFSIIAYGNNITIFIRGHWAAEISNDSIAEGDIAFAAASYESAGELKGNNSGVPYVAEVFLDALSVDSRLDEVSALYETWRNSINIDAAARLRLAETFTAMTQYGAAMTQIRKAQDAPCHRETQRELLLAGRISHAMGRTADAESYIRQCLASGAESAEGREAVTELAKVLYAAGRLTELAECCAQALEVNGGDPVLWTFQGHALWDMKKYKKAAESYDRAFKLDPRNGLLAKNAANVYDVMNRPKDALERYLQAGSAFLQAGNYNDLGLLVPILLSRGEHNYQARSLAGKWAFAVDDWQMADREFKLAETLRKNVVPPPKKDGAQVFLQALLLLRWGRRRDALPLLQEAARLEKNYALFRFRLAENLFLLEDKPDNPQMRKEMDAALSLVQESPQGGASGGGAENEGLAGWVNNFAAQVALRKGDLNEAGEYLEKATAVLGDVPAVRVNRAVLCYLRGSLDQALALLEGDTQNDPDGTLSNCAGNLLVRAGQFEDADARYQKALVVSPNNTEYLCNRASCLIELGLFGEADKLLAQAHTIAPSPALLEMISYVAVKKGEYTRAEQACRAALELDPAHAPSLLSLGWILLTLGRYEETREIIRRLDALELGEDTAKSRQELHARLDDLFHRTIECASCSRFWRVEHNPPPVPALRLFAMPPDELPAGSCLACGKTFCIGCAKKNLDGEGRFICPGCNRSLKLVNNGLKKIVQQW